MPLGTEVNLGPGEVVLDGVAAPPKKTAPPQFSVRVYCGQTAGWMKTPLGTKVHLCPGHIVLDGVPALCERGTTAPPLFGPCPLWSNGGMHQDATWYGGRPPPRRHGDPASPSPQKRSHTPSLRPMSIVVKRMDASARMPLGTEVGLSPGDIVLDGDPAPPP